MSLVITTPTGHIGSRLVSLLLEAGADLTLLVRNPDRLDASVRNRVKIQQGDQQDRAFVQRAVEGANALFWVTPSDPTMPDVHAWYEQAGESVANAVRANGIPYVVNISSVGAQLPDAGPVTGLGQVERHLNATDAHVLHLRPGYFMENLAMQTDALRHQSSFYEPVPGNIPFPMIATRDIADYAARRLQELNWTGKQIQGLHGPADLSFEEIASILSEALGKPIQYVNITPEQMRQALLSTGMGPAFAQAYLELMAALARPGAVAEPRTPQTATPTTLHQWISEVLKPLL